MLQENYTLNLRSLAEQNNAFQVRFLRVREAQTQEKDESHVLVHFLKVLTLHL